ncbi:uncharacterized protein [Procambarus clarkii]|uniref:uncharacterized protein n=1 Tax=Procambarus clarkii TaxID=6728 RepID=UPI001E672459|nr:glutaredoxin-like [Procambarus clarkii]XP_045581874.1 glutaredoxin-like [Procambarus clarkii]
MGGSPSCQIPAANMKGPVAEMVKEKINTNCVVIFSKTYCPYCKIAKKEFGKLGIPYEVYELDKHSEGSEVQDVLDVMTGARTVPRVFVGGKCIGGGTETTQLSKSGKLLDMVKRCQEAST